MQKLEIKQAHHVQVSLPLAFSNNSGTRLKADQVPLVFLTVTF